MRRPVRTLMLALAGLAAVAQLGCGRGCSREPAPAGAPAAPAAPADVARSPEHPALAVEPALGIRLPERQDASLLPGWPTFPWRRLPEFRPDQHLTVRVASNGVGCLERSLDPTTAQSDARVTELLRWALDSWQRRSGVAANRLVLAIDRNSDRDLVSRVRNVALQASLWRVVGLSRDDDQLTELLLSPPPDRRPNGQPMPSAPLAVEGTTTGR